MLFNAREAKKSQKAFTLIELLVVIAIIAILAAILFPVFARAREQARKAACQSNLKQIGMAVMMYVQDYDEKYPMGTMYTGGFFYRLLEPYVKNDQVWICPTAGEIRSASARLYSGGYGWNICGMDNTGAIGNGFGYSAGAPCTPSGAIGVTLAEVSEPAQTILAGDPASNGYQGNGLYLWARQRGLLPVLHGGQVGPFYNTAATSIAGEPKNFQGGGNYLYADGHVKLMMNTQAWADRQKLFNIVKN
jgi:prepilin-type N-terminal cleavage/methylation domain-containing protein/prepilin-type processing-associated H-X9-DG protein